MARTAKPTLLFVGQQHGDEPASAESLLVLSQELARGRLTVLLERINVIVLPRVNPDGALAAQRASANGVDIDTDHLLLRTPEAQAVARLAREYQPVMVLDAQEYPLIPAFQQKFNALQRADLQMQYATTPNLAPFLGKASEEWFRRSLLNKLKQDRLAADWVYTTSDDPAELRIAMGSIRPDNLRNVSGLKNAVSFVIESRGANLGRVHLKRRVFSQLAAIVNVLYTSADRGADLLKLRQYVEAETSAQACQGTAVIEAELTPAEYALRVVDPRTGTEKALTVAWDSALTLRDTRIRKRACAYWLAADQREAVAKLRALGVRVEQVTAKGVVQGESYADVARSATGKLEAKVVSALIDAPVGSYHVPLGQPLGHLVTAALEPDSPSSYVANGVIKEPAKLARLSTLSGLKTTPVP